MENDYDPAAPELESHPWEPYGPHNAKVLIMGTFPPQPKRWAMDFYYPNRTNDFWPMMGLIFLGHRDALLLSGTKNFDLAAIKRLLDDKGIALNDTGRKVRRLKGNASDKYLEIVEPVPLRELLGGLPSCRAVVTTGEKAASVVAELTSTPLPKMGEMVEAPDYLPGRPVEVWRMPSTSRAYPLALEKKAAYYRRLFEHLGMV